MSCFLHNKLFLWSPCPRTGHYYTIYYGSTQSKPCICRQEKNAVGRICVIVHAAVHIQPTPRTCVTDRADHTTPTRKTRASVVPTYLKHLLYVVDHEVKIGDLSDVAAIYEKVSSDRIDCFVGRRARVLTAEDPTTLEVQSGDYYEDVAAERGLARLQSKKARTSKKYLMRAPSADSAIRVQGTLEFVSRPCVTLVPRLFEQMFEISAR